MNPFLLSPNERVTAWKACRENLRGKSEADQLSDVVAFWSQAPLENNSYDLTDPNTWPSPWEMLHAGNWCRKSLAIGMEFTLRLGGWQPERMKLIMAHDQERSETVFVVEIDGEKLLNYDFQKVAILPVRHWYIIGEWKFSGKLFRSVG